MIIRNLFPKIEAELEPVADGRRRRVGAHSDSLMVVEVHFDAGVTAPMHHHRHQQITYVMSGKFEFTVGDRTYVVGAGD